MKNILHQSAALVLCIGVCFVAPALGSLLTAPDATDWYASLEKPSWTPPGWVFGPVWTCLYLLMGISAWQVWRKVEPNLAVVPLTLFAIQLAFNVAWSFLFFGLQSPGAALIDIVLLLCAILATTVAFWRKSVLAGSLMLPYLAWVGFAAVLNLTIWNLNK